MKIWNRDGLYKVETQTPNSIISSLSDAELVSAIEDLRHRDKTAILPEGSICFAMAEEIADLIKDSHGAYSMYEGLIYQEAALRWLLLKRIGDSNA